MEKFQRDIVVAIVLAILIIVVLVVFALLIFLTFIKRKRLLEREQEMMKIQFAEELLKSQLEIQEQTLRNISHEIHDNIGQILSLVALNLNLLKSPDVDRLDSTTNLVEKAINDLRTLSKILNPEQILKVGLKEALEVELHHLEKSGKFSVDMHVGVDFREPNAEKTIILYRMAQEVLNNIIKHAEANHVYVRLAKIVDGFSIVIGDNGKGFEIGENQNNGIGHQNLHKRASMINTEVKVISSPGNGTEIAFLLY